ncbi:MAG: helix-turn-helix domain-containing protein [Pseudomonadota bacterium]|nr:MAG: helix-turn-helix domain-containing protein [Pseudomonadota bacterium]
MIVRKLRLRHGWSQDQLAEMTDLSVRTIQRLERGHKPSLETAKALAAVFEVDCSTFTSEDNDMTEREEVKRDEIEAMEYAKGVKDFYSGVVVYFILAACFFGISGFGEPLLYWVFGATGLGLVVQGLMVFEVIRLPFQDTERRLAEKKLGRKL